VALRPEDAALSLQRAGLVTQRRAGDGDHLTPRRPYAPPRVTEVALRAEEAVLAGCKHAKVHGPGHGQCQVPSPCSTLAS
jgi:hypothetical protein